MPVGKTSKLADKAWIEARLADGLTMSEIARTAGVTTSAVSKALQRHGLRRPRGGPRHPELHNRDWLDARFAEGLSATDVAGVLGCSVTHVQQRAREMGVELPRDRVRLEVAQVDRLITVRQVCDELSTLCSLLDLTVWDWGYREDGDADDIATIRAAVERIGEAINLLDPLTD